jgi:small subunit ribosomal protein S18
VPPSSRKDRGRTKASDPKGRVRRGRPKVCIFCTEHIRWVDYKDMNLLRRFMSDRGKIKSRANTGTCSQHQSDVALAIKNARELALLPYAVRTLAGDKSAGRRGRGGPGGRPDRPTDRPSAPPGAPTAGPTGDASSVADAVVGDGGAPVRQDMESTAPEAFEASPALVGDDADSADASADDEGQS